MSQSVVITGGQGSLARSIAEYFRKVEPDWKLLCPSRHEMDITSEDSIRFFFKHQSCDLLIAAAGEIADGTLARMSSSDWDRLFQSNLRGAAYAAKSASESMIQKRNGHVLFVGSFSAYQPPAGQVVYASAKAALIGLTKSLAREWGNANLRVNMILPGFLENRMTSAVTRERKKEVMAQHCLGRYNTESCVAAFIHTLHTRLAHTSGQIFNLDSRILTD